MPGVNWTVLYTADRNASVLGAAGADNIIVDGLTVASIVEQGMLVGAGR